MTMTADVSTQDAADAADAPEAPLDGRDAILADVVKEGAEILRDFVLSNEAQRAIRAAAPVLVTQVTALANSIESSVHLPGAHVPIMSRLHVISTLLDVALQGLVQEGGDWLKAHGMTPEVIAERLSVAPPAKKVEPGYL